MSSSRIENLVQQSFNEFHRQRLMKLNGVMLSDLLHKKNIYLLCATGGSSVSKIVQNLLEEYISSSDENIFGDTFFEAKESIERVKAALSGEESLVAYEAIALIHFMRNNLTQDQKDYKKERDNAINKLTFDFLNNFGNQDGSIDWEKLLRYNSGKDNVPWVSKVIPATVEDQEDENNDDFNDGDDGTEDYKEYI